MYNRIRVLLFSLFAVTTLMAQRIHWYTTENNISNNRFQTICEDANGYIWIGTENGLNRYDGYNFVNFYHNPDDSLSLLSNYVRTLYCADDGILWVGTNRGIQYVYPNETKFHTVNLPDVSTAFITNIIKLSNGDIWVATSGKGIYKILPDALSKPVNLDRIVTQLGMGIIRCMVEDYSGQLWLGTPMGVYLCDPVTLQLTAFQRDIIDRDITGIHKDSAGNIYISTNNHLYVWNSVEEVLNKITDDEGLWEITHTFQDGKNNIFVSLRGNGLLKYDRESKSLVRVNQNINDMSLDNLDISAMYRDKQGNLWFGCFLSGLAMTAVDTNQFGYSRFSDYKENISGVVTSLLIDKKENLWIGYNNKGLTCIDKYGKVQINRTKTPYVSCFHKSKDGDIWVGLISGGLAKLDIETGNLTSIISNEYAAIYAITEDSKGRLFYSELGSGFTRYTPGDTISETWSNIVSGRSEYTLSNDWIYAMFVDDTDILWLGHDHGIDCYDVVNNKFLNVDKIREKISAASCYVIKEDSEKRLWFGTNMGLLMYDRDSESIKLYTDSDGLSNKIINGIEEDQMGNLWISTQSGLNKLNPDTDHIDRYFSGAGLIDRTYNKVSAYNANKKIVFFASNNGITYFKPDKINTTSTVNNVILTNFYINDEHISASTISGNNGSKGSSIINADKFTLSHKDKSLTLEFTTLNYGEENSINYEYTLDNNQSKWLSTKTGVNVINFFHLKPGTHTLYVRARMNDSYSEIKAITIRVSPPWYLSIVAYCGYFVVLVVVVLLIVRSIKRRGEQNVSEAKLQAFTNIAHEICTPMTMIISPLEELMKQENLNVGVQRQLLQMHKSSTKILSLINQLLDLRKYDEGQMRLQYREVDFVNFIMGTFEIYTQTAERREIDFTYTHSVEELPIWIDVDSLDKVMMNLLSNAFKYTADGGSIHVKLDAGIDETVSGPLRNYAQVSISDNGIGLDIKDVSRVFDRFYRSQNTLTSMTLGMGIGLNFCRALIDMHRGNIWAENRTDTKGSVFTFRIPLGKTHINKDDFDTESITDRKELSTMRISEIEMLDTESNPSHYKKVLVVDDDDAMLEYISNNMKHTYKVITCKNGVEGLRMAVSQKPDLVITDVVMPEMDGITLLRKLKMNVDTSHIPVIVLSGKNKLQDRMLGIETGADAYLPKPFYMNELKSTAANLISNRLRMKGKYSAVQHRKAVAAEVNIESSDDQFLNEITAIVNKNISNSEFNVEQLMKEMRVSKSKLHRKIKDLTGSTPAHFIMNIRMQHAKEKLAEKDANVSHIAYDVGFSSQTHFSTTFKSYFGYTPTDYLKQNKAKNEEGSEDTAE